MALTDEEKRKCRLYLDVPDGSRSDAVLAGQVDRALRDVSAAGEITARTLLEIMDMLWAELFSVRDRMQAEQVGSIRLRRDEWDARLGQWKFYQARLGTALDVSRFLSPVRGSGMQGPWREP
jgi:hypothetical protein